MTRVRETGLYATHDDITVPVAYRDGDRVALRNVQGAPHIGSVVPVAALDRLERVTAVATWRSVRVVVDRVRPSRLAWIRLTDAALADELDLYGSRATGWATSVALHELDDLREEVEDLLTRPDEEPTR